MVVVWYGKGPGDSLGISHGSDYYMECAFVTVAIHPAMHAGTPLM